MNCSSYKKFFFLPSSNENIQWQNLYHEKFLSFCHTIILTYFLIDNHFNKFHKLVTRKKIIIILHSDLFIQTCQIIFFSHFYYEKKKCFVTHTNIDLDMFQNFFFFVSYNNFVVVIAFVIDLWWHKHWMLQYRIIFFCLEWWPKKKWKSNRSTTKPKTIYLTNLFFFFGDWIGHMYVCIWWWKKICSHWN